VFLTWQSSKVTVQHQNERLAEMITGAPELAGVINEFEVGEQVADAERHDALNPLLATAAALPTNWSRARESKVVASVRSTPGGAVRYGCANETIV